MVSLEKHPCDVVAHTHVSAIEKIMDFTTNSTRVPDTQGTNIHGIPVESGLAPAILGLTSNSTSSCEINDEGTLNFSGRVPSDRMEGRPKQFFKCRNNAIVSTFNANTLSPNGRLTELILNAKKQSTDVIAIQEHRLYHPDDNLKSHTVNGYQLVTCSATKNSVNATIGGIGFLLSPKASENKLSIETISSRIMVIELAGNPKSTIICCYSPHNSSEEHEVDNFYSNLRSVLDQVPAHNFLLITGDFNARLGPTDTKFTYNHHTNRNGEKLIELMEEYNLFSTNNNFMKSRNQLWTFEYPSGERAQIDYILARKKWRNSVKNSRSYSSFSSVGSDHRIVSATIKLSLRSSKRVLPDPIRSIDWKKVNSDTHISSQYSINVFNRFEALTFECNAVSNDIETTYSNLMKATEEVALSTLPKKQKRNSQPIEMSDMVIQAREKLKKISSDYHAKPSASLKKKLTSAKKCLDNVYLEAEEAYIKGKINDLSELHISKKHSAAWQTINDITGKRSQPTIVIKGGCKEKRMNNWTNHFQNLLGKPPDIPEGSHLPEVKISDTLDIPVAPFTLQELKYVIRFVKNKQFGPDKIPAIIWKDCIFHQLLLDLCNYTFVHLTPPSIWRKSQIIPVPKKGDLSLPTNYRGISLLPIAAKIYNKLILYRLLPKIEPLLRNNQNGFRAGRSTISQVLTLRRIIEEITLSNLDAALIFVDFRKAFDSIHREQMFTILELYGIPTPLIDAIKVLYTGSTSSILTPDGETDPIDIVAGILQGDTLAPFLFIIVIDYVLRISVDLISNKGLELKPRTSSRHPAIHITDTDFADDIALIANSRKNAQDLLTSLESAANCVGLHLNETKTEYIDISQQRDSTFDMKTLGGKILKQVDDYKYLGSCIMNSEKDFKARKGMAWSACNKMENIWKSHLDNKTKVNIFRATIEPILLYGSETWTLSAKNHKLLDGTYTRLLRRVKNLSWRQHPTLRDIYGNLPRISQTLRQRRAQFAGHCLRATNELSSSLVLWKARSTCRSRKLSYPTIISKDTGIPIDELKVAMEDRNTWREIVKSISAEAAR